MSEDELIKDFNRKTMEKKKKKDRIEGWDIDERWFNDE